MIEQFCPPCPEPEEFRPTEIVAPELCPCPPAPTNPNPPYMPRRLNKTVETDCYSEMIRKMTSTFHCNPFDAC